ncbi:hypothetical protein N665_1051s0008 [Sinapis alba]|nr:hypothetical protein N665_1051s0008 [Sinapis alba]
MTSYTENIGRRVKAMGLKSVVVKVNGFTHFKNKNAIVASRSGYSNSRNDQNPIVYTSRTRLEKFIMVADWQGNLGCEEKKRKEIVFADLLLLFYGHYRQLVFLFGYVYLL